MNPLVINYEDKEVRKRLDSIFPQLSELIKDNMLEISCFKLSNEEIMSCLNFIISSCPIKNLDIPHINKQTYPLLQNYIYSLFRKESGKFCLNLIILFEYFVAQISTNTIICLMDIIRKEGIDINDNMVIDYINRHIKVIKNRKKFLIATCKVLAYKGTQNCMYDPNSIDEGWLKDNFKQTDKLGGSYIPKKKNHYISYIYKDYKQVFIAYRNNVKLASDSIFGNVARIDDTKYWEYVRQEGLLILKGCNIEYTISYEDLCCSHFNVMYGLINITYDGKILGVEGMKGMVCRVNGSVLYNKLFNTNIDDVRELILDVMN